VTAVHRAMSKGNGVRGIVTKKWRKIAVPPAKSMRTGLWEYAPVFIYLRFGFYHTGEKNLLWQERFRTRLAKVPTGDCSADAENEVPGGSGIAVVITSTSSSFPYRALITRACFHPT